MNNQSSLIIKGNNLFKSSFEGSNELENKKNFIVQYKYILASSIEVKDKSDFKQYVLRIVNQLGSVDLNITLIPLGKMSYCVFGLKTLF
jgi:uncharacterized protein (DUF1697 family)